MNLRYDSHHSHDETKENVSIERSSTRLMRKILSWTGHMLRSVDSVFYKSLPFVSSGGARAGGYFIYGRIHMINFGFGRPTLPSTKIWASNLSIYQKFLLKTHPSTKISIRNPSNHQFYHQTHLPTKIWCSKLNYLTKFNNFKENDPLIYIHQPFQIPASKLNKRIHENMQVPP